MTGAATSEGGGLRLAALIAALLDGVHADDDKWDGYDGSGVHGWQPGQEVGDCRICAALAAAYGPK